MKLQSDKRCDPRLSVRSCRLGRKLMDDADERLFRRIMNNSEHVLQPFLPGRPVLSYNLRRRPHCNKSLITKTVDLCNYHSSNLQRQLLSLTLLLTKQSHHCTLSCFTHLVFFLSCIMVAFVNFITRAHHRDEKPERDLTYHLTCLLIYHGTTTHL